HLLAEPRARVAIKPIRDEEDHRALRQHSARPAAIELAEALADACAAGPVLDGAGDLVEGHVDIAVAQEARDVREPGPEKERIDAVAVVGDRVHEMQEEAAVAAHRARDIAEDDQRRWSRTAALAFERDQAAGA